LPGRWVPTIEHATDVDLKTQGLKVYAPKDIPQGWYWLGQTLDPSKALIVKESTTGGGLLKPVTGFTKLWDDAGSGLGVSCLRIALLFYGPLLGLVPFVVSLT